MSINLVTFLFLCTSWIVLEATGPKDPGLIQNVEPNFEVVKGLICYQCRSFSNELQPLCADTHFHLVKPQEKYNISIQCPHYQGTYCFKNWKKSGKVFETTRGCSGPTDKNGHQMKVGCMKTQNVTLCLCDKKFCNEGKSYRSVTKIVVASLVVLRGIFKYTLFLV